MKQPASNSKSTLENENGIDDDMLASVVGGVGLSMAPGVSKGHSTDDHLHNLGSILAHGDSGGDHTHSHGHGPVFAPPPTAPVFGHHDTPMQTMPKHDGDFVKPDVLHAPMSTPPTQDGGFVKPDVSHTPIHAPRSGPDH